MSQSRLGLGEMWERLGLCLVSVSSLVYNITSDILAN